MSMLPFDIHRRLERKPRLQRPPMLRGISRDPESKAMELPEGKTCADCAHCKRCCAMFGHMPEDQVCDWHPSRFTPATPVDPVTLRDGSVVDLGARWKLPT